MGTQITTESDRIVVKGTGGRILTPLHPIYLGNNGTAIRLLTTVASLGHGVFTLTGDPRLCERPIGPLLAALRDLGVEADSRDNAGFPPVILHADGLRGGYVSLRDLESSQYISSLLIGAPYAQSDVVIDLKGHIPSLPYVEMTLDAMAAFGQVFMDASPHRYIVRAGRPYIGREYAIEGDVSSASYFFLAAMLLKGRIRVENINPRTRQGDMGLVSLMETLGASVQRGDDWIEMTGGALTPGERSFDLGDMPDMVPTFAVLAALRPGRTVITNVAHLRYKESNRLAAMATELVKVGIDAKECADGLVIEGGTPHGAEIETYNDHRIAMSFAVLGLITPGMVIRNSACVNKSFPEFWETLDSLYKAKAG
jgi:3-phosphoshikimate 1-carboxyvinyltransferase